MLVYLYQGSPPGCLFVLTCIKFKHSHDR